MSAPLDPRQVAFDAQRRARLSAERSQQSALRLHALLRAAIREEMVDTGERLNEEALVSAYGMSRNAVRRALSQLAEDGLATRSPRQGTAVASGIASLSIDDARGDDPDNMEWIDLFPTTSARVKAPPIVQRMLRTDEEFVRVSELLCFRYGRPYALHTTYRSGALEQRPTTLADDPAAGVSGLFQRLHGVPLARVDCHMAAVTADEATARVLDITVGAPLVVLERVSRSSDGVTREYSHTHYVASQSALSFSMTFPVD